MKKIQRLTALVLCACLCLGLTACAGKAGVSTAQPSQEVVPPSQRATVDFTSLQYSDFDSEAFLARVEAARALLKEKHQEEELLAEYHTLTQQLEDCVTQYKLSEVYYYLDCGNEQLQQTSAAAYTRVNDCNDAYSVFLSEILASSYRKTFMKLVGEENALMYEDYEAMTDEQKSLMDQEKSLEDEYTKLAGEEYDSYADTAAVMAPLYLQLVQVRNRLAQTYEYDNYVDYAYENIYFRSYTPEDARELEDSVKENLSKLYVRSLIGMTQEDYDAPYRYSDASQENLLALMQDYMPRMSASLGEALQYMLACNAYDIGYSDKKYAASFTTMLNGYDLPFLFSQPTQDSQVYSLDTLVHEFGHYYSYLNDPTYTTEDGYVYSLDDIDVAEINSTGLELLFLQYYPELYGEDAETLEKSVLSDILSNVVFGCLFDEFQQEIYTEEDLTTEEVSEIFYEVFSEYMGDIFVEDYSRFMWSVVNHNFDAPLYYISYGVSALAAFQLWENSQTDFDGALQQYLTLTAYGTDIDFVSLLDACKMQNIFEESYLDTLYKTLAPVLT